MTSLLPLGLVFDLGNVLIEWDPTAAVAAGVGAAEAQRFMTADDFDFMAWNHGPDSGGSWADAEAEVRIGWTHTMGATYPTSGEVVVPPPSPHALPHRPRGRDFS